MQKKFSHPQTGVTPASLRGNIYPLRFARPPKIEGQFLFIYNSSPALVKDANRWTKVHRGKTYVYIFPQKKGCPAGQPHKNIGTFGYFFFLIIRR